MGLVTSIAIRIITDMKPLFTGLILFIFLLPNTAHLKENPQDVVEKMGNRILNVIDDDWIIEFGKTDLTITFCRSCGIPDSTEKVAGRRIPFMRYHNFEKNGPDSVGFETTVNPTIFPDSADFKFSRKPEGILQIKVRFEKPISEKEYNKRKANNDTLIAAFQRKGVYNRVSGLCGDFRGTIPDPTNWGRYLSDYDFYFQRMPYQSYLTELDVYIEADLPGNWSAPFYVDRSDEFYYMNHDNSLWHFYPRTLFQIAYALGIKDYKTP